MENQKTEVVITTKNTPLLTLGIISLVIGAFAILVGWIPFLGLLAIPFAIIGLLFAAIGALIALFKKSVGISMPLLGGLICMIGFFLPILSTGGTSAVITKAANEVSDEMEQASIKAAEEKEKQHQQEQQEKDLYIMKKLQLYDVKAEYMSSFLDGRIPGIVFKIKNLGNKSLDKVEVTIYFKDAKDEVIYETDFLPVLVSEFSLTDSKPLKPGYVWQMETDKFYSVKSVPSEWQEGNFEAKITDIRFSK